jgi:anthranilate synthase component 1
MTIATDIHADLITPLGAYLRLRAAGAASFLLESVEKGRLGRYSLVGSGSRLVSFEDAGAELDAGRPVVGYLGYDHVAKLEPTVVLPEDGPDLPESRFVVADRLVRFDHVTSIAEVLAGDRNEIAALLEAPPPASEASGEAAREAATTRSPSREAYEDGVRAAKEHIRIGDAFQIVLSQRAEGRRLLPRSRSTARSGASIPRPTSSCSSWAISHLWAPRRRPSSSSWGPARA